MWSSWLEKATKTIRLSAPKSGISTMPKKPPAPYGSARRRHKTRCFPVRSFVRLRFLFDISAREQTRMKPLTIRQVRQAVGGKALSAIPADAPLVEAVCTDTRRMDKGALFIALRGDRHNAHAFLPQAAGGGAVAALVEEPPAESLPNVILIQVPDTRLAMGKLAASVRKHMKSKVIAVAGSNG